jgi:hypothetical protein
MQRGDLLQSAPQKTRPRCRTQPYELRSCIAFAKIRSCTGFAFADRSCGPLSCGKEKWSRWRLQLGGCGRDGWKEAGFSAIVFDA